MILGWGAGTTPESFGAGDRPGAASEGVNSR
jgi:hypothetical protein